MVLEMAQELIGQRIKFLIDSQKLSVRRFAQALDIGETNIRNYIDKGTKPSSDILERIAHTFPKLNLVWLITGSGEPYLPEAGQATQSGASRVKNNYGNNVGNNQGTVSQQATQVGEPDALQTRLTFFQQENESLRAQLAMQAALVASQAETIALLKSALNRPS